MKLPTLTAARALGHAQTTDPTGRAAGLHQSSSSAIVPQRWIEYYQCPNDPEFHNVGQYPDMRTPLEIAAARGAPPEGCRYGTQRALEFSEGWENFKLMAPRYAQQGPRVLWEILKDKFSD